MFDWKEATVASEVNQRFAFAQSFSLVLSVVSPCGVWMLSWLCAALARKMP